MDAKDLRTESALSERNNDGSKYSQSGGIALHCDRNKSYQDIGSNSLAKVDVQSTRPCAVIGPDRVVPPSAPNEAYLKKGPTEPWPCMDNAYHARRPPEYPHKLANFQNPTRNISPRQTFQENMQRIMVPPSYNSVKISDDTNYVQISDRSNALPKNIKINVPPEAKFCDVPYSVYPTNNEQKNVRNAEMCMSSVNPTLTRTGPHGWPPGSVNVRPTRTYGAPELYQYQEYPSCAGPRPVVPRPNRTVPEEPGYVYADPFYHQEGNIRFKPYPTVKDRFPQQRYEYIGNYANSFHTPPTFPAHKYDIQKNVPPHPYPPYPPIKYLDRVPEPVMEGYQRNQQASYNIPYRNQIIHPNYGPVLGNCPQNKIHSYPSDAHMKSLGPNKLPFDNAKAYIEYENGRPKMYPPSEGYLVNEMGRVHSMKSQVIMPNYPTLNMHNIPPNPYYKKDNQQIKNYEYLQAHYRSMDPNINIHNPMIRHPPVFSPNTSAISPTDSSTSNDTSQTLGNSQEDCGYVSQSSSASARSIESGINRIPNDCLRKYYDSRYGPIIRTAPMMSKSDLNANSNSKEKKNIDVRQFLQMWNEGDEETEENSSKEIIIQSGPKSDNFIKTHEVISQSNQEQLYVLGLVNVPSEELGKYEHIQKVSKLPENIKGYNHIELLNQFEEAIESSNMTNYKTSTSKDFQMPSKVVTTKQPTGVAPPRPLSPLDVEAKISQSVIHKEVGCNFEIKPCSPKMLNVEVATPVQNLLAERAIEKVANPVMLKSPRLNGIDENLDCNIMKRKEHRVNINNEPVRIPSCKMVNTQFSNNSSIDTIKNSYSLQDLESNSGLCLASLPRLDNDIELNFPEVNQQFINANKGEASVSTSLRDLPSLELLDQSDSHTKDKLNDINSSNQINDVLKSPCIIESEKEFSKLSKYRKNKTYSSDSKENQTHVMSVMNAARTDSVIIKNPENIKNYEEKNTFSPNCLNKQASDIQQVPINLTSQGNITENTIKSPPSITPPVAVKCKENESPIEIAIDFSLNKNSSNENVECIESKNTKQTEIVTHNMVGENQSILEDDHLSKLQTFTECDQNIQHAFINNNKMFEHAIPHPIKYSDSETVQITKDKDSLTITENPSLEGIFIKNKCSTPVPAIKDVKDVDDSVLSASNVNEINNITSNSLLPIEFVSPTAELLQADNTGSNYLMDVDKQNEILDIHLDKSSSSLVESDSHPNVFQNDDNVHKKDVLKNEVTYMENTKVSRGDCPVVANSDEFTDMKLSSDTYKSNVNQIIDISLAENSQEMDCDHLSLPISTILEHNKYQSNDIKENADSTPNNCNIISSNNIVPESQDEDIEPCDIVTHHSKDLQSETGEQDANFNSSSPNVILSPASYLPDLAQQESDPNLKLSTSNDMFSNNKDVQLDKTEIVTELPCSNNVSTDHRPNSSEIIKPATPKLALPNHIATHNSEDDQSDSVHRQSISNFSLPSPSNIAVGEMSNEAVKINDTSNLLEEVLDNRIETLSTEEIHRNDIIVKDFNEITDTWIESKLSVQGDKNIKLRRYLSYGSKEMYSPWFQKLVLFWEGNVNSSKDIQNKDGDHSNNFEVVADHNEKYVNSDYCSEEDKVSNNILREVDNRSFSIEKDSTKNVSQKNYSDAKECFTTDSDNVPEENIKSTVNQNENTEGNNKIVDSDEPPSVSDQQSDKLTTHLENNQVVDSENKPENASTDSLFVNDTEDHFGKTGSLSHFEEARRCMSPRLHEKWDIHSNCSDEILEQWDKRSNHSDVADNKLAETPENNEDISERWDKQSDIGDHVTEDTDNINNQKKEVAPNMWDRESNCDCENIKIPDRSNAEFNCTDDATERWDKQSCNSDDMLERWEKHSNCSEDAPATWDKQSNSSDDKTEEWNKQSKFDDELIDKNSYDINEIPNERNKESSNNIEMPVNTNEQTICNDVESSITIENEESLRTKLQTTEHNFFNKKRQPLKRSLSDSALNFYSNNSEHLQQENEENVQLIWPFKRRKMTHNDILAQDLCNIIQNNRRNSISAICNEENVSFCILIDNGCIIAEEENDEQEKICYTELSEECLAEINECTKDEESLATMTEVIPDPPTPPQENACEYSDSFIMQGDDEKLEESWVEDVACVETVISDDIAEDIEISEPVSPKDDMLSDNDESGVFSSSEHTDKVKYIYGDKMCNDDAQFVETLYNTPQMDVNKTLVQRESLISGEYYDNDSLEKILSESNDKEYVPYVPEYAEPVYSPRFVDVTETVENKENMVVEINSPLQSKGSTFEGTDTGTNKTHQEDVKLCELFDETQDDTVHSCESSVDNVFTYKENDENTNYTSSSPEVSSTTSEEKKSAILLKITNYQGSRISQINDITRDSKRPSCKFTEDKDYVQSQSNFSTHRPLLTKAAQKYIPPLKESMRDLKVKLSLPQHSLMKLKQLKISKDEPKVCKQNVTVPRISKKPKPKFEDVLKSIDEIQIKMHKEKNKKSKKSIPKVVIKKNENGSHYASTSNKEEFNPDLTGRKWQPWVFIEKNNFIDKMAMKKKTKAIYSHRKRTYVLAEKFQKYKSVNSGKFVISPPISDCPSAGLKYTIRLKHNY